MAFSTRDVTLENLRYKVWEELLNNPKENLLEMKDALLKAIVENINDSRTAQGKPGKPCPDSKLELGKVHTLVAQYFANSKSEPERNMFKNILKTAAELTKIDDPGILLKGVKQPFTKDEILNAKQTEAELKSVRSP